MYGLSEIRWCDVCCAKNKKQQKVCTIFIPVQNNKRINIVAHTNALCTYLSAIYILFYRLFVLTQLQNVQQKKIISHFLFIYFFIHKKHFITIFFVVVGFFIYNNIHKVKRYTNCRVVARFLCAK